MGKNPGASKLKKSKFTEKNYEFDDGEEERR